MTRTTLDIDVAVLEQLRERALAERKSMGQVASELLGPALARRQVGPGGPRLRWEAKHMGTPLLDIDDKEALGRLLDKDYLDKLEP